MKRTSFLIALILIGLTAKPQDISSNNKVPASYDRSSITLLFVDFSLGGSETKAIKALRFSDKYDNNNLESLILMPSFKRDEAPLNKMYEKLIAVNNIVPKNDLYDLLIKDMDRLSVGRMILAKWYNRKPDGTMDMDLVHQRGRFTATDADVLRAQTSKRGNAALEEFGNRLINQSFIQVIDLVDLKTSTAQGSRGWTATANSYLFRIDFNDQVRNAFYDTWIYDDDPEELKTQKRNAFDALQVPVVPVSQKSTAVTATESSDKANPRSYDELMNELIQKSYEDNLYRHEMDVPELQVVTPIYATNPLRAKIGLKEGLKTDHRYFVYEYVYNSRTSQAEPKRRGVIRAESASKIVDNRHVATGQMDMSQFYQVHGLKLREGYTIVQKNDNGVEAIGGWDMGEIGGINGRLEYRLGFTGVKAVFAHVELGWEAKEYPNAPAILGLQSGDFSFLRVAGGISKGLQLTRNIEFRPYLAIGLEQVSSKELDDAENYIGAFYLKPGGNIAINLFTHNFQVFGGAGYFAFITEAEDSNENTFGAYKDVFENRSGLTTTIGFRIGF